MTERRRLVRLVGIGVAGILLPLGLIWWLRCGPSTTIVLVRHADRDGTLDALRPEGVVRAQELVHVGQKAGLSAIYHSNTNRTRDTAAPLATALGLTPVVYPANDVAGLLNSIYADHQGETVLVVGHSNTVPDIIEAAGGPARPDIDAAEFDDLFVLNVCRCGWRRVTLTNLQYGAASP